MTAAYPPEGYEVAADGGLRPAAVSEAASRRTSWTAVDLMTADFAEPRFAVDNLIPEGLAFMCGAPKLGKSWMALGLSIAVAAGGKALGTIPVDGGEVLYLALEDSSRRLQSRLRVLLEGEHAPDGLQIETAWPRMDEGGADALDEWLDNHMAARLILIDVWPRIRPRAGNRSDYFTSDYDGAAQLQGLATQRGVAIVALYHTRKATRPSRSSCANSRAPRRSPSSRPRSIVSSPTTTRSDRTGPRHARPPRARSSRVPRRDPESATASSRGSCASATT